VDELTIRPAREDDRLRLYEIFSAAAEEHDGIATEAPVPEDQVAGWNLDGTLVALAGDEVVGQIHVEASPHGFGDLGMVIAKDYRGRGVGSALMVAAIDAARERGLHKIILEVFPHNEAGIALYRKFGFVEEGRRVRQYRRQSGEQWDAIQMGLLL